MKLLHTLHTIQQGRVGTYLALRLQTQIMVITMTTTATTTNTTMMIIHLVSVKEIALNCHFWDSSALEKILLFIYIIFTKERENMILYFYLT